MSADRRARVALALAAGGLLGVVLWAYLPVLDNWFLCDDFSYLKVGDMIRRQPGLALAQGPVYEIYLGAWRRPLGNLLWAGLVALFGFESRPLYLLLLAVHLANAALLGWWLAKRTGDRTVAVLGAGLFATAYGVRDVVCWLSNLNEALCLTLALAVLLLRERRWHPAALAALVLAGCLIKESLAPLLLVLPLIERLEDSEPGAWRRLARRWAAPAAMFAAYLIWRLRPSELGYYSGYRLGWHLPANWLALVTGSFASDLLPIWLERRVGLPALVPYVNAAGAVAVLIVALRRPSAGSAPRTGAQTGRTAAPTVQPGVGPAPRTGGGPRVASGADALVRDADPTPARALAIWILCQALAFAPMDSFSPRHVPARYLYLAAAPAMGLVAMAVCALWRAGRRRRGLILVGGVLTLLLADWQVYGLLRLRDDERGHWDRASRMLRRDLAAFDAAALPPDGYILLLMPPEEVPGGGTWWGWEGYPLVARQPVRQLIRHVGVEPPADIPRPYALFRYSKEQGPRFERLVE